MHKIAFRKNQLIIDNNFQKRCATNKMSPDEFIRIKCLKLFKSTKI